MFVAGVAVGPSLRHFWAEAPIAEPIGFTIDGRTIQLPEDRVVGFRFTEKSVGGEITESKEGLASSLGGSVTGDGQQSLNPEAATVQFEGMSASGGGGSFEADLVGAGSVNVFYVIGALCIIAGLVVAIWLKKVMLGVAISAAGGALIAIGVTVEQYPWIWMLIVPIAGGGFAWWFIDARGSERRGEVVNWLATAMAKAPKEIKDQVMGLLEQYSNGNKNLINTELVKAERRLKL